jgi:hypothetical protein
VDWLFDAIVRSVSPAAMPFATDALIDAHDGHDPIPVRLLTLDAKGRVESLRDDWIEIQADYHERNAKTMDRMASWVKKRGERLSSWVVVVVIADLLLVIVELREAVPPALHTLAQIATPVLIATSALLPAVVAALNGVRFQSECQRLAERSAVMGVLLHGRGAASRHGSPATQPPEPAPIQGRAKQADELHQRIVAATTDSDSNSDSDSDTDSDADPGSWSFDALHLTEIVATDFVQEAAEWSVLYAQELPEPG